MYTIYLGASTLGTRLGQVFAQNVKREALIEKIRPALEYFRDRREVGETFGDFCDRVGIEALREAEVAA
jgi:sulfite reductase (ferredoxin)